MPRQNASQEVHRPFLQGLRQERMVGKGHGRAGYVPGRVPGEVVFIHQDAHEFRHGQGWVGVVKLDGHLVVKLVKGGMIPQVAPDNIPKGAGHQKIFLDEPQFPAGFDAVAGVKDLGDILRINFLLHRPNIVALVENADVKA